MSLKCLLRKPLQILCFASCISSFGQIDSLRAVLSTDQNLRDSISTISLMADYYIFNDTKQAREYIDMQIALAEQSRDSILIVDAHNLLTKVLMMSGDWEQAKKTVMKVKPFMESKPYDLFALGNNLGIIYGSQMKYDSSRLYYLQAKKHARDSVKKAIVISNLAILSMHDGDMVKAAEECLYAIRLLEEEGNSSQQLASTYSTIGSLYANMENFEEAAGFYLKSIAHAKKSNSAYWESFTSMNLANLYEIMDFPSDSVIRYYNTAQEILKTLDDHFMRANILTSLAAYYEKLDQLAYAIQYIRKAETVVLSIEDNRERSVITDHIARFYFEIGDFNQALYYAKRLEKEMVGNGAMYLETFYQTIYKVYDAVSDRDKAYEYLKKYTHLHDSISNVEHTNKISELEIEYQTEIKDQELTALSQQSAIQTLEIKQKNQALIIGIVVFLLILAIVYFVYRERGMVKDRARTELEQRFLRSQLNPHFIFNALMAIQTFMLKNDAPQAASYLTKFSKLMREILEHSREKFIPVEAEVDMITNYLDIHKLRSEVSFEYSVDVDENIDSESDMIPPMFLQPFVENAIEHGIANLKEKGLINIRFVKEDDHILIEVTDNGKGFYSKTQSTNEHHSLASTIIQERIDLLNRSLKKKIKLLMENIYGSGGEVLGARVALKVPLA